MQGVSYKNRGVRGLRYKLLSRLWEEGKSLKRKGGMGICKWCDQEMLVVDTCIANFEVEFPDGSKLPSLIEHFNEESGLCHDYNIKHGGHHHPGCDAERCPKCGGQLISCGCLDPHGG